MTRLNAVRSDVYHTTIYCDVLVIYKLTSSSTSASDTKTIYDIVKTTFESLKQKFTGDTASLCSLIEEVTELLFENAIGELSLVLLGEHDAVFRGLATTHVLVATLHTLGSVAEDVFTELARKTNLRTCISCHIG